MKLSLWEDLRMLGNLALVRMISDPEKKTARLYEMYPPDRLVVEDTNYYNLGYWPGCTKLDEAAQALADEVADTAEFKPDDTILDVGFGYGDQDFHWIDKYGPSKIIGINITKTHIRIATDRAKERGLTDRIDFREGSATAIPLPDNSVDKVVALESAFHFATRADFFAEAHRVLRPGGVLVTADIIPMEGGKPKADIRSHAIKWIRVMIDDANWYPRKRYGEILESAGFESVEVRSIRDEVYEPWREYHVRRLQDPTFKSRSSKLFYKMVAVAHRDQDLLKDELKSLDYVVSAARKPQKP
ncbi:MULTISPECIES: cyclopropane-fatty-acyl-phospholipid synthase family protein [unclassified Streptomyces]|uniref:SAM-dependent methyltransferase n=1 Tax=unclassified Streptomyces TaxID=2593676 RepID=UPI000B2588CC|nr:class I SAM-dependent methyltransferase [Streptomyces sp. CNQ-509]